MCRYDNLPDWCLPHARAVVRFSGSQNTPTLYHIWMPFGVGTGLRSRSMIERYAFKNNPFPTRLEGGPWFKVDRGRLYLCGDGVPDGDRRPSTSVHELNSFEQAVKWLRMANEMVGDRYGDSQ